MLLCVTRLALGLFAHTFKHILLRRCVLGEATGNGTQRLCPSDCSQLDLSCPDAVGRFVEQADWRIAMRRFGLIANRWIGTQGFGQFAVERVQVAETDLVDNRNAIQLRKQRNPAVRLGAFQSFDHQSQWIKPIVRVFGAVVDLAYANDDGDAFDISHAGH